MTNPKNYFWNQKHGANRIFKYNEINNLNNNTKNRSEMTIASFYKSKLIKDAFKIRFTYIKNNAELLKLIRLTKLSKKLGIAPNLSSTGNFTDNKSNLTKYTKSNYKKISQYRRTNKTMKAKMKDYNHQASLLQNNYLVIVTNGTVRAVTSTDVRSVITGTPVAELHTGSSSHSSSNTSPISTGSNVASSSTRSHSTNTKTTSNKKHSTKYVQSSLF